MERITTLDGNESLVRARSHFMNTQQLRLVMIVENDSRQHSDTVSSLYLIFISYQSIGKEDWKWIYGYGWQLNR